MNKSGLTAFLLGFIPGMGHMYLRKFARGFIYPIVVLLTLLFAFLLAVMESDGNYMIAGLIFGFLLWGISMIDLLITIFRRPAVHFYRAEMESGSVSEDPLAAPKTCSTDNASGTTIALAFIPGLGHLHLGLMYRGLTFLISFFGLFTMVFFITALTNEEDFLIFLGVLPIIWIYNLFDVMHLYHKKNKGETLVDRTIFEELLEHREEGKKSKMLAMFLSLLPGAGHMYLGLQRRGLQLMAAFLLSIYILDVLHLSLFLFLIPILWFFSFFDALQQLGRYEQGTAQDVPIVDWLMNHQRWVGFGLLGLGLFYIVDNVAVPTLTRLLHDTRILTWYELYFQTTLVSLVLIIGGIKLLLGSKKKGSGEQ